MLKKAAVVGLTGLALGVAPAGAGSIGNGETVALSMLVGGGVMSIGCMATVLLTQDDQDDRESYDRRGIYVALSGSYARENFSNSTVVNLVDGELQDNLRLLRRNPDILNTPNDPRYYDPGIIRSASTISTMTSSASRAEVAIVATPTSRPNCSLNG